MGKVEQWNYVSISLVVFSNSNVGSATKELALPCLLPWQRESRLLRLPSLPRLSWRRPAGSCHRVPSGRRCYRRLESHRRKWQRSLPDLVGWQLPRWQLRRPATVLRSGAAVRTGRQMRLGYDDEWPDVYVIIAFHCYVVYTSKPYIALHYLINRIAFLPIIVLRLNKYSTLDPCYLKLYQYYFLYR